MANVLFCTQSDLPEFELDSFRKGFVDALVSAGNIVKVLISNRFTPFINQPPGGVLVDICDQLKRVVEDFNPDLVVTVNNAGMFDCIRQVIDVPIYLWFLDGPAYAIQREQIVAERSRYQFLIATKAFGKDIEEQWSINSENIHYMPLCSNFEARDLPKTQNISFVGTYFWAMPVVEKFITLSSDVRLVEAVKRVGINLAKNPTQSGSCLMKEEGLDSFFIDPYVDAYFLNLISLNRRLQSLSAVSDLGLSIYGNAAWRNVLSFSLELFNAFQIQQPTTQSELEQIYNSSRININVSHAQARGGIPWRVFDILATSGLLISDNQADLHEIFSNDLVIPTFENPVEAREKCIYYLENENARTELIAIANEVVNKKHRFKHRVQQLSEITGVNLENSSTGSFEDLLPVKANSEFQNASVPLPARFAPEHLRSKDEKTIPIQIFQSETCTFSESNSFRCEQKVWLGRYFKFVFSLGSSSKYLRLDIGDQFAIFKDLELTCTSDDDRLNSVNLVTIGSNKINSNGNLTVSGYDPYYIYINPYPNKAISISIQGLYLGGFN